MPVLLTFSCAPLSKTWQLLSCRHATGNGSAGQAQQRVEALRVAGIGNGFDPAVLQAHYRGSPCLSRRRSATLVSLYALATVKGRSRSLGRANMRVITPRHGADARYMITRCFQPGLLALECLLTKALVAFSEVKYQQACVRAQYVRRSMLVLQVMGGRVLPLASGAARNMTGRHSRAESSRRRYVARFIRFPAVTSGGYPERVHLDRVHGSGCRTGGQVPGQKTQHWKLTADAMSAKDSWSPSSSRHSA